MKGEDLNAMGQAEYRSLVGQLMRIDRTETRNAIGKLATKLGHATVMDRKNAVHVLRQLKGVTRVMTVEGRGHFEDGARRVSARASTC